jgi:hypothetical protein
MNASDRYDSPILTLEPFLEAVREGLESSGWELSGLQKTTSFEFEGRWAGDSSRSAYLFFHREGVPEWASIDVFLDETSRGLKGNLALVLEGPDLDRIRDPAEILAGLGDVARTHLPAGYRNPITLRYRLPSPDEDPLGADSEIRFKLLIPTAVIGSGPSAVTSLARSAARAFQAILQAPEMNRYVS